jgi:uncharacterized protein
MRPIITPVSPTKFFVLTFILSWLIWIPLALSHFEIGPFAIAEGISSIVRLLGVLMPAAAALILTSQAGGRGALRSLLSRLVLWRVQWKWWFAAVFLQPILLVLASMAINLVPGNSGIALTLPESASLLIVNVVFLLIAVLGEEIGWRGVALPALEQRQSAWKSSVILGLLWATWHIPFWLLMDTFDQYGFGYIVMNFLLFPFTFFITWFFNHGRFSILLAVAFHLTFNIVNTALLPVTTNLGAFGILIALEWIVALFIFPHMESEESKALRSV